MSGRARNRLVTAGCLPLGFGLGQVSQANAWSPPELYAAIAVAFVILITPAVLWVDSAPDGPMRHRKRR